MNEEESKHEVSTEQSNRVLELEQRIAKLEKMVQMFTGPNGGASPSRGFPSPTSKNTRNSFTGARPSEGSNEESKVTLPALMKRRATIVGVAVE